MSSITLPANSSIRFEFLVSSQFKLERHDATKWNYYSAITYVMLAEGTRPQTFEDNVRPFVDEHFTMSLRAGRERYGDFSMRLKLQPLSEVHLAAGFPTGMTPASDPAYPYITAGIALVVLMIACVNFTNLSMGRVASRFKEAGVRKLLGASRRQLAQQIYGEVILLTIVGLVVGLALAEIVLPIFNNLVDRELAIGWDPAWVGLVGLVLAAGLLAGSYPALVISRSQPIEVFKGRLRFHGGNWFSRGLIVGQFVLSTGLIILTLLMAEQMDFLRRKNLGYEGEQVIAVHRGYSLSKEQCLRLLEVYQNTAAQHPSIQSIAAANAAFGGGWAESASYSDGDWSLDFFRIRTDGHLMKVLGMELVQGRGFLEGSDMDLQESVIVNETLVQAQGWEDPIGQILPVINKTVIGVVRDFHLQSLHNPIKPVVMRYDDGGFLSHIFFKVRPDAISSVLKLLESKWQQVAPEHPFVFSFLDENMEQLYREEERWGRIVRYSALFAIMVACLGALGLTSLSVAQRTKEIGIRKVLGASAKNIVVLLSKEFTYSVIAANLMAWPLAYWAIQNWLQDFAYRIEIGAAMFGVGGLFTLLVVLVTVNTQAIKAAWANPVDALRYE